MNYNDLRKARYGERTGLGHLAKQAVRKKKGVLSGCYVCGQKGRMARESKSRSDSGHSSAGNGSDEASGPGAKKQGCFKHGQPEHFARECKQGGRGSSVAVPQYPQCGRESTVDTGCTDHMVRDRTVFCVFESWSEGKTLQNPNGMLSRIEGRGSMEVEFSNCPILRGATVLCRSVFAKLIVLFLPS